MNISSLENGNQMRVILDGNMDTISSPKVEKYIFDRIDAVNDLIIDMEKVDYISSAAIRVIMKTEMKMRSRGRLKLENVNELITSIFRSVNLDKYLDIEEEKESESEDEEEFFFATYVLMEEDLEKLPVYMRKKAQDSHSTIYAATDEDDDMIAFAICNDNYKNASAIVYIYVKDEFKDSKVKESLIAYCLERFKEDHGEEAYLLLQCDEKDINAAKSFGQQCGFQDFEKRGAIFTYTKDQIKKSELANNLNNLESMLTSVKLYHDLDEKELFVLNFMLDLDFDNLDPVFTRFYESDGKISGLISATEVLENQILLDQIEILAQNDTSRILILLLASMIKTFLEVTSEQSVLYIDCEEQNYLKGIRNIFGKVEDIKYTLEFKQQM